MQQQIFCTFSGPSFYLKINQHEIIYPMSPFPYIFDDFDKSAYGNGRHFELAVQKGLDSWGFFWVISYTPRSHLTKFQLVTNFVQVLMVLFVQRLD